MLQDVLIAEPLDVQGAARDEVADALGGLGGAAEPVRARVRPRLPGGPMGYRRRGNG